MSKYGSATYQNDLEEHFLVDLHELLVPLVDVCGFLPTVGVIIGLRRRVALVVLAPLNNLFEDRFIHLFNISKPMTRVL